MTDPVTEEAVGQAAGLTTVSTKSEFILKGRSKSWTLGSRTGIMGVLNVTPDSFYDGGLYLDKGLAVERALRMIAEGADWVDVGGESTRPGAAPVAVDEELRRTIPVVEALAGEGIAVSIDTMKAEVAESALDAGAEIVNDVSALGFDPRMVGVCASYGAGVILMHKRGTPESMQDNVEYTDILSEVRSTLAARVEFAIENGIDVSSIAVDPGIGFGKSASGSLELIRRLGEFKSFGRPLLVGLSRKSFIGHILDTGGAGALKGSPKEPLSCSNSSKDRLSGTIAACTAAVMNGAHILRVHDVKEAYEAAAVADCLKA